MTRVRLAAVAAIVLCGCRAILGVESLTVEDGGEPRDDGGVGGDATTAPSRDASAPLEAAAEASEDAPADRSPPPDSGGPGAGVCADAGECPPCCRDAFPAAVEILEKYAIDAGCLCQPDSDASCGAECAGSICSGDFANVPSDCNMCVDPKLGPGSTCATNATNECTQNSDCVAYLNCLGTCPAQGQP